MHRIAVISDIHFGRDARSEEFALPGSTMNGNIRNTVPMADGAVSIMQNMQAEYLLIAGDLTSIGSPSEYHFCQEKILDIADKANIPRDRILWCAGNHDNDWSIAKLSESTTSNDGANPIHPDVEIRTKEGYRVLATSVCEHNLLELKNKVLEDGILPGAGVFEDENMIVFVLNSSTYCIPGEKVQHGKLTCEQLEWLEKEVKEYSNATKWKVILMHHHPFNYPFPYPSLDISQLEEGSELCDIAGKNGIDLVIHGHRHHPKCITRKENDWNKPVTFICGGSFSVNESERSHGEIPNMFHIIELGDNINEIILYSYEYTIASGWQKVSKYREEVPLDHVMKLGKIFDEEEITTCVDSLVTDSSKDIILIEWQELPEPLSYKSSKALKELLNKASWSEQYSVKLDEDGAVLLKKRRKS